MNVPLRFTCWEDFKLQAAIEKYGRLNAIVYLYAFSWLPLFVLARIDGEWPDIATNIRLLVSLPLLLLSFSVLTHKENWILEHFHEAGLLTAEDESKLSEVIERTDRFMNSFHCRIFVLLLGFIFAMLAYFFFQKYQAWSAMDRPAGWLFHFLVQPLYNYIILRLVLHLYLWIRVGVKVSRMDLNIWPAHGDGLGGLSFMSSTLIAKALPAFALSSSAAAGAANLVVTNQITFDGLKLAVGAYTLILVSLFIFPLLVFIPKLLQEREQGIRKYGVLASLQAREFFGKWLSHPEMIPDTLEVGDFSAMTDYSSEVGRVYQMSLLPMKFIDVVFLLFVIAIPFLFVFSLKVSWSVILSGLFSLL